MAKYRGGIIGLGYMGLIGDLGAKRIGWHGEEWGSDINMWSVDDHDRPTSELDVHRRFHYHEHPGKEWMPTTFAEALWDRPEVDLVAGAERDKTRLKAFGERYGIDALYADAEEMLRKERLDIVAIPSNVKGRADLTCLAVEHGAKGIFTEKPMAHTLEEADRMVKTCADAGVFLNCGLITTNHPSFGKAKELVTGGAIGDVVSMEAGAPIRAQHQNWSYFVDSPPAWVVGTGDAPPFEDGQDEFEGEGMMVTQDGLAVHFRKGAPGIHVTGTAGEISFARSGLMGWRLWQDIDTPGGKKRAEVPWPDPQFGSYGAVYMLADIIDCLEGRLDEPKNSGRRVAVALEVEMALKLSSARDGARVDLPLEDRSLRLNYHWFR